MVTMLPHGFEPWIGSKYRSEGWNGLQLLVLGESHYGSPAKGRESLATQDVVHGYLAGEIGSAFFTKVARLIHGSPSAGDAAIDDVWSRIAFYNYIQSSVGRGPRIPPTSKHWAEARVPFLKVLRKHTPDGVVVLGERLWRNLAAAFGEGTALREGRGSIRTVCFASTARDPVPVITLRHPSGRGFRYSKNMPKVTALLRHLGHE